MIEILSRYTRALLYKSESASTTAEAVAEAVNSGADLRGAYLRGADLRGADLGGADLGGADLRGADLRGAYLRGAYLGGGKGLLSKPIQPLQIQGSAHLLIVRQDGYLTIGCHHNPLTWWEEHYAAVGRKEDYTADQVGEYRLHIAHARQWMEAHGVVNAIESKEAVTA